MENFKLINGNSKISPGKAWRGGARQGIAWLGEARRGTARQGAAPIGAAKFFGGNMLFLRLLPLAIAAIGVWELRAIRKVHQARWDYERLVKITTIQILSKKIAVSPPLRKELDKAEISYLSKPSALSCIIRRPEEGGFAECRNDPWKKGRRQP